MTRARAEQTTATRPVILVGYVAAALSAFADLLPAGSVIFVEEPDIVRKREAHAKTARSDLVRELIEWEHYLPGKADEFFHAHRGLDPAGIVPMTEYATPFAARLAERWGLPGAGFGAAQILRDKALLRKVSRAAGIANPEMAPVAGPQDVLAFMRSHPGPVVLKPANRQASVGTQVIRDTAEVGDAWLNCLVQDESVYVPDRPIERRMLVERFVSGHEYSVEMLVRSGEQLFFNVTGKQLFPGPRPVELAHVVPADIGAEPTALLGEQTLRVIDAVGFRDGIVHCEWIVCDGVPFLVECAGRFAGDGIIDLIQRAYPVELNRAYFAVMRGEPLPVELPRQAKAGAAVHFLSIEPGVVVDVRGIEDARKAAGVYMAGVDYPIGARFDGLRSSWDRAGEVMVTAASPAEALRLAEAAAGLVHIETRPAVPAGQSAGVSS